MKWAIILGMAHYLCANWATISQISTGRVNLILEQFEDWPIKPILLCQLGDNFSISKARVFYYSLNIR